MHSVQRSPDPNFLDAFRKVYGRWDDLTRIDRPRIRRALSNDFGGICAYCERLCEPPDSTGTLSDAETIDHFRPRNHFPGLWLDWLNLVYSCQRCNKIKGSKWPGIEDEATEQELSDEDTRYTAIMEYVNPNALEGQRPADEYFSFNLLTGEIVPEEELSATEWSMARRTIWDIDLNDGELGGNVPNHLINLRMLQRDWLFQKLNELGDFESQAHIMLEFTQADKPFSSFISAWVTSSFPQLGRTFREG